VYNTVYAHPSAIPIESRLIFELSGELVLDSFLFHAVLRDKSRRWEILSLPHHDYQNHRLDEALAERNYRMAGTGQWHWRHACDGCMKLYQGQDNQWCELFDRMITSSVLMIL
jgi:hypothetical protein